MKRIIVILAFLMIFFHLCGCHQSHKTSDTETKKGEYMEITDEEFYEPNKKDLPSIDLLKQLYNGMPYRDAIKILGKPQRAGPHSGFTSFEWDFKNGEQRCFIVLLSEGDHDGNGSLTNIYYYGILMIAE